MPLKSDSCSIALNPGREDPHEHDPHDHRRRVHHRHDRHHVAAEFNVCPREELRSDDERDDADRTIGRRHGGSVIDAENASKEKKRVERYQHSHCHRRENRPRHLRGQSRLGEFLSACVADRYQQVGRKKLRERVGKLEIRMHEH